MLRLFFGIIVLFFAGSLAANEGVFTGRVALDKTIADFKTENPAPGTLYLLTGAAATVTLVSEEPFAAEVDFVEAQWLSEAELVSSHVQLSFSGSTWSAVVVNKKPRTAYQSLVYPYRKFQVAAVFEKTVNTAAGPVPRFRVVAIPLFF
jgi:hypothetical protein